MLIFYIDEYGDHSLATRPHSRPVALKDGVSPWFILSAVGVRDSSRKPLAEAIFDLKRKHFGADLDLQPWGASEIKGRFLFRAARSAASGNVLSHPDAYKVLDTPAKVDALTTDVGRIFTKFRPLIFATAVDKTALLRRRSKQRVPPLGAAYTYLQQRVALTMEQVYLGEGAILVADQQTQHETYFRSGEMNRVRDDMTKGLSMKPNFNLVLDKPLWVDTNLSTWDRECLQLADIVAYSVATFLQRGTAPSESCYLWDRLLPYFAVQWSTGQISGGGISVYPRPPTAKKT